MAQNENDNLDRLLRDWLSRRIDETKSDGFRTRESWRQDILEAVIEASDTKTESDSSPIPSVRGTWSRRTSYRLTIAASVSFVAALVLILFFSNREARKQCLPVSPPVNSRVADAIDPHDDIQELRDRLKVIDELDMMFEQKWSWMIECNGRVDMYTDVNAVFDTGKSAPVAVRMTVMVAENGTNEFRVTDKTFIMTHEQQAVDTSLADDSNRTVYLWVLPLGEGLYSFEFELDMKEPESFTLSTGGILRAGSSNKILTCRHAGNEHRVYLALLPGTGSPESSHSTDL